MPRKIISEFRAKTILHDCLGLPYVGVASIDGKVSKLPKADSYVVKVDQAVKKRGKQGLIELNVKKENIEKTVKNYNSKGYKKLLIEPFINYDNKKESYFAMQLTRNGLALSYGKQGGVDVESNRDKIKSFTLSSDEDLNKAFKATGIGADFIKSIAQCMQDNYFSYLEINPLVINGDEIKIIDLAVEVDDAGSFFVESWNENDFRFRISQKKTSAEQNVEELNNTSQASFRFEILNPNGAIFMLLSGGGASVTLADEFHDRKFGSEIANYGEYSGAPNREETRYYTQQLLNSLFDSKAKVKSLVIAGGVANFTDVKTTFLGIIDAMEKNVEMLNKQNVKVYIRRGGPNEKAGLQAMKSFLEEHDLLGCALGSEASLSDVVDETLLRYKK